MPWIFAVIGFAIGLSSGAIPGAIGGAAIGYMLAMLSGQRRRIRELQSEQVEIWAKLRAMAPDEASPLVASKAEAPHPRPEPSEPEPKRTEAEPVSPPVPRRASPPPVLHEPSSPKSDDPVGVVFEKISAYFTGASLMVTLGVVVLFFGVAFLLKYAVDQGLLSIELRLIAAAASGIAMVAAGWRTRESKPSFGRALQGGGVGVLYLTVFAAYRLYQLLPGGLTFLLLVTFVALSSLLAVLQDSRALAILGTTGGFLAPVLASTGQGSHVALFSYYVVLNAGILAISWFKSWRSLNLAGFGFTFILSGSWALRYYTPSYFATTEPFLIAFFLMYVAIAVAFAVKQEPRQVGLVDGTLVFGVPLVTAVFQAGLVKDYEYGLAWSALALGVFYVGTATVLFRTRGASLRALCEAFLGEGVVFATLAVPFAFEGLITSAFWALEGAAILWVGVRQNRMTPRLFGAFLQVAAGVAFLVDGGAHGDSPIANSHFLGATLIAVAALASSLHLSRGRDAFSSAERWMAGFFFGYGLLWWLAGSFHEIETFVPRSVDKVGALLLLFSFTAAVSFMLGRKLEWRALARVALGLLPAFLIGLGASADAAGHPLAGIAALGWLVAIGTFYWLLKADEDNEPTLAPFWHAGGFVVVTLLLTWEASYRTQQVLGDGTWSNILWGFVPAGCLLVALLWGKRVRWPLAKHWETYTTLAAAPIAAYLVLWTIAINTTPGDPAPLPYLPFGSPLDITVAFSLLAMVVWYRCAKTWFDDNEERRDTLYSVVGGLSFLTLHGVVIRTVHHWMAVPFTSSALFDSGVVQTAIAVLWAVTGLASMVIGSQRGVRIVWTIGATLMGAVVVKLFLVDLSHTGTVARIVSFLGVGLLLLAVGYLSPVPPRERHAETMP